MRGGTGITCDSEIGAIAGRTVGELVRIGFSYQDGAGIAQLFNYVRITSRHIMRILLRSHCARNIFHIDQVFDGDRHAMQRPQHLAGDNIGLRLPGLLSRFLVYNRDVGIQR